MPYLLLEHQQTQNNGHIALALLSPETDEVSKHVQSMTTDMLYSYQTSLCQYVDILCRSCCLSTYHETMK